MADMQRNIVLCPPPDDEDDAQGVNIGNAAAQEAENCDQKRSAMSRELQRNFQILKKRKVSDDEASRVAEETQAMIRTEVRRMQNAVAELEAYLDAQEAQGEEDEDANGAGVPMGGVRVNDLDAHKNRFPALPRVVVVEQPRQQMPATSVSREEEH